MSTTEGSILGGALMPVSVIIPPYDHSTDGVPLVAKGSLSTGSLVPPVVPPAAPLGMPFPLFGTATAPPVKQLTPTMFDSSTFELVTWNINKVGDGTLNCIKDGLNKCMNRIQARIAFYQKQITVGLIGLQDIPDQLPSMSNGELYLKMNSKPINWETLALRNVNYPAPATDGIEGMSMMFNKHMFTRQTAVFMGHLDMNVGGDPNDITVANIVGPSTNDYVINNLIGGGGHIQPFMIVGLEINPTYAGIFNKCKKIIAMNQCAKQPTGAVDVRRTITNVMTVSEQVKKNQIKGALAAVPLSVSATITAMRGSIDTAIDTANKDPASAGNIITAKDALEKVALGNGILLPAITPWLLTVDNELKDGIVNAAVNVILPTVNPLTLPELRNIITAIHTAVMNKSGGAAGLYEFADKETITVIMGDYSMNRYTAGPIDITVPHMYTYNSQFLTLRKPLGTYTCCSKAATYPKTSWVGYSDDDCIEVGQITAENIVNYAKSQNQIDPFTQGYFLSTHAAVVGEIVFQ